MCNAAQETVDLQPQTIVGSWVLSAPTLLIGKDAKLENFLSAASYALSGNEMVVDHPVNETWL